MSNQTENTAIENFLTAYTEALNSANSALITSLYTEDGLFMPNGFKTLSTGDLLKGSKTFFKKAHFHIDYAVPDTVVDGDYAFVQTTAKTMTTDPEKNQEIRQTSRDFFVLRKEKEEWKIFRYTFNNLMEK